MKRSQQSITTIMVSLNAGILLFAGFVAFPHLSRAYGDADAEHGRQLFEQRCTGCHSLDQNKVGPHLRGVYGRQAGKVSSFNYSAALQSSQLT
jgi:cytochrome c2